MSERGFTLLEVMIATMLSTVLLLMVSQIWSSLGRSLAEHVADGDITADAALTLESLRRDLSGYLPGATTGVKPCGRLVGRSAVGGDQLRLCFDGPPEDGAADWSAPDHVVAYSLDGDQLVRTDLATGAVLVVAAGVEAFLVTDLGTGVRIELTISRRQIQRTFQFVALDP